MYYCCGLHQARLQGTAGSLGGGIKYNHAGSYLSLLRFSSSLPLPFPSCLPAWPLTPFLEVQEPFIFSHVDASNVVNLIPSVPLYSIPFHLPPLCSTPFHLPPLCSTPFHRVRYVPLHSVVHEAPFHLLHLRSELDPRVPAASVVRTPIALA